MNKQKKHMIILIVVLVVIFVGYFAIHMYLQNKKVAQEMSTQYIVTEYDKEKISELTVFYNEETFSFVMEDNTWKLKGKEATIDQTSVDIIANKMSHMIADYKIENFSDLTEYGLADPTESCSFLVDGKEVKILVGNLNAITDKYYVMLENGSDVYCVSSEYITGIHKNSTEFIVDET